VYFFFFQVVPVGKLISGSFKANFALLKWFRKLFTENTKDLEYNPVEARAGEEIRPTPLLMSSPQRGASNVGSYPQKTHPSSSTWLQQKNMAAIGCFNEEAGK